MGNNILNIASKLDEDERALRILIAAEKCGTNIDHWNHKAESPTGHGIYTNKAFFTARILKNTSTPYIRLQDGTDAMLMFSNYPHENEAINFMNIARERGLSVNTHDELGNTPLINAINTKKTENTINYLLTNGANPNICDNFKQTPLHHACINGNVQDMNSIEALIAIETIEKLLDSYAYPFAKDLSGQMPFDYLSEPMKEKLLHILKRTGDALKPYAKPFGIRAGVSFAIAALLSLVGVLLVCGTFVFLAWLIATLVIFGFALLSIVLSMALALTIPAVNKVLMTVYSFSTSTSSPETSPSSRSSSCACFGWTKVIAFVCMVIPPCF